MRQCGDPLSLNRAQKLQSYLESQGIACLIREETPGVGNESSQSAIMGLWVFDEDQLSKAEAIAKQFVLNPDAALYNVPNASAAASHTTAEQPNLRYKEVNVRSQWASRGNGSINVTLSLILISLTLTLTLMTPLTRDFSRYFFFSEFGGRNFPEILHGQVWRLVTPVFMHGGFFHLGFNMLWLYQLGAEIERQEKGRYYLLLILIMSALINSCQYLVSGPMFLGMSGIVYMLFGYVWMMARFQAKFSYGMPQQTVTIMLAWLVICLVGLIPGVANTEHVAGLFFGVAWGFIHSGHLATIRRRRRFRS